MRLLLPLLFLACLGYAQIFGPAGVPLSWDFGIISFNADTLEADSLVSSPEYTSPGANLAFYVAGDTLIVANDGSADNDVIIALADSAGARHPIKWNTSIGRFDVTGNFYSSGYIRSVNFALDGSSNTLYTTGTSDSRWDPGTGGGATAYIGQPGDGDALVVDCTTSTFNGSVTTDTLTFESMIGFVREVTTNYTVTLSDWQIVVTDTLNVTLPALSAAYDSLAPLTGNGFQVDIKLTADAPCTLFAAGADSIDGGVFEVLTQWDNLSVKAVHGRWIKR